MPQMFNQSEQSKSIKRINERIKQLTKLQSVENPYLSPYSRAIRETGVEFTKRDGQYIIRNTAENQKKVEKLEKRLKQLGAKTVSEIKKQAKKELQSEAKELAKGKPKSERKKFIKDYTSKEKVHERIQENLNDVSIQEMLDLIYHVYGKVGLDLGLELSSLTKGIPKSEQNHAQILDCFGRIKDLYRKAQNIDLEHYYKQRKEDLHEFYRTYGYRHFGDEK